MFRSKYAPKSAVKTTPTRRKGAPGPVLPLSLLLVASGLTYLGWKYNSLHPDDQSFEVQRELIGNGIKRFLGREKEPTREPSRMRSSDYGTIRPIKGSLEISFDIEGDGIPERLRWDSKVQPGTFVPAEPKIELEQKAESKEPAKEPVRLLPEPLAPPPLLEAKDPCYQTNVSFGAEKEADFSVADGEAETFTLRQTKKGLAIDSLVEGQTQIAQIGRGSKTKPAYFVYEHPRAGEESSSYILVAVRRKRGQSYDVESCFAVPEPTEGVVLGKVLGSIVTYHPQSGEVVVVQTKKGKMMSTKTASPAETDSAPALDLDHRLAHELFTVSPHEVNYTEISRPLIDFDVYIRDYDRVARSELGKKAYQNLQARVRKLGDDYRTLTKEFFPTELKDPKIFTARDMVEGFAVLSALRAKAETGDVDARYYTYAHLSRHLVHIAQAANEAGDKEVARSTGQEALNISRSMLAEFGETVRPHTIYTKTLVGDLGIPELR